jgi:oligopeptide transport system ATP-binding protein
MRFSITHNILTHDEELFSIPGTPPDLLDPPKGDAFAARNPFVMKIDLEQEPPFFQVSDTHYAATWLLHPNAPKVNPPEAVKRRQNQFAGNAPTATLEKTGQGQFPGKKEGK